MTVQGHGVRKSPDNTPHIADAVDDLEYFGKERNLSAEKMVLGVPFYGYGIWPGTDLSGKDYELLVRSYHRFMVQNRLMNGRWMADILCTIMAYLLLKRRLNLPWRRLQE